MLSFTPEENERYRRRRDFRIAKSKLANYMTRRLGENRQQRLIRQKREEYEKLGLPWPPPPEPPSDKKSQSRKKREETSKQAQSESTRRIEREQRLLKTGRPLRSISIQPVRAKKEHAEKDRIRSAEKEQTEFSKAELTRNLQRSTGYSHALVSLWKDEASAQAKKAQAAAQAAAEAAIKARMDLASVYNNEGEAALRTATEAAKKAEANLVDKKAYFYKFESGDKLRKILEERGMAVMTEAHAKQTRITDKIAVKRLVGQIFSLVSDYARHARRANLTELDTKWTKIIVLARSLETSVDNTNETDTKSIINHLGTARTMIENTSLDNEPEADKIIQELSKAQAIGIKNIAASRPNKAGLRRTKKTYKKT